jgi:hypothetical protein
MKTLLPLLTLCASLGASGCTTHPPAAQRAQSAARLAAYVGTADFLITHPEARPRFESAIAALRRIETSENVDLPTLLTVVQQLPVHELKSDRTLLIVSAATLLLADYTGALPVEQWNDLRPLARAIREGIELGLTSKPE